MVIYFKRIFIIWFENWIIYFFFKFKKLFSTQSQENLLILLLKMDLEDIACTASESN